MQRAIRQLHAGAPAALLWLLAAAWLAGVTVGGHRLIAYANTAGPSQVPSAWPAGSGLRLEPDRLTLCLFLHPHCPCSRATLAEFERLIVRVPPDRFTATAVFVLPDGATEGWGRTSLRARVETLSSIRLRDDAGGHEARLFGAQTSGTVVVFRPDASIAFAGGITGARGHEGDNAGSQTLEALLRGKAGGLPGEAPVFGCPLCGGAQSGDPA